MSENRGKDGEMRFAIVIAAAAICQNGLDFTRHTLTNQPDLGEDYSVQGSVEAFTALCKIGTGEVSNAASEVLGDLGRKIEARFDVKTTPSRLAGDTVDKFISDVKKHPNTDLHVLVGGSGLTKTAKRKLDDHGATLREDGKAIVYIPNEGVVRLANEYKPEILSALDGLMGAKITSEDEGE
jgi:hypothetical protein